MRKFSEFKSAQFLNRVNGLHSLLTALNKDECRCIWPNKRATSRMFLDMPGFRQDEIYRIVRIAKKLRLIRETFSNPYIIGHGENFIGLTPVGLAMMKEL